MNKREAAELQMLAAIKVWLDCDLERRPSSRALGDIIEKYADEFDRLAISPAERPDVEKVGDSQ